MQGWRGERHAPIRGRASQADRDLTSVVSVIDDPVRSALAGGRALPAGELARRAGLQPRAASMHLRQLTDAGLIRVRVRGRHRYHEIVNPEVASVLEAIAHIAPPTPVRSLDQERAAVELSEARTCYAHLAGRRGVQMRERLLTARAIRQLDDRDHELTDRGQHLVEKLGIDLAALRASRRVFARSCVDWSDRRVLPGRGASRRDHERVPRPRLAHRCTGSQAACHRQLRRQDRSMAGHLMPGARPLGWLP